MGSGQRRAPPQAPPQPCKVTDPSCSKVGGGSSSSGTTNTNTRGSGGSGNGRRSRGTGGDGGIGVEGKEERRQQRQQQQQQQQHQQPHLSSLPQESGGGENKKASELWHIHGRHFDLTPFLDQHPGGSSILEAMRGAEDITPVFESYHALAHSAAIRQSLEKFEWVGKLVDDVSEREAALVGGGPGKEPLRYRWEEGGFYAVLTARVKTHFLEKNGYEGADPRQASVNRFVKAPRSWYAKELLILAVYVPLLLSMLGYAGLFFRGSERDSLLQLQLPMPLSLLSSPVSVSVSSRWTRAVAAVLAGALLQSFSFCTLHDASHYGLLFKRPRVQELLSRVCNAWTLWHHGLWVMHHVYGHHSFTGDPERDPDLVHARPYLRKSILAPEDQYDPFLVRRQRFFAPVFMMLFPGATLGQTQAYLRGLREGNLWHVSITAASGDTRWYEYLTYVAAVGLHLLGGSVVVSFCYFMGISMAYHLCVAPDHDTFESSIVNSIETKRDEERRRAEAARTNSSSSSSSSIGGERGAVQGVVELAPEECSGGGGREVSEERATSRQIGGRGGSAPSSGCTAGDMRVGGAAQHAQGGSAAVCQEGGAGVGEGAAKREEERQEEHDDWGEVQVRHSGNFSNGNPLVTQLMGGINFQIEHHLFPSMSHMLYSEIAPIVQKACAEFNIPYNAHPSLWSAYKSYLKHLVVCSEMAES